MEIIDILILVLFVFGFVFLFFYLKKRLDKISSYQEEDKSLALVNQNLQEFERRINAQTNQLFSKLGGLTEIGRGIESFNEFLKSPKFRGNIGEEVLRHLLEEYFSKEHFEMQYRFKSGERVDAILKTKEGIIPIDAKFPLANFQKWTKSRDEKEKKSYFKLFLSDVKKHISKIAKKYILPEEGTVDFAVMYIPSETIYYELIQGEENLSEFARQKSVYLTSPNSFYYFLKVIMMSMRGTEIQENAKKILKLLEGIRTDSLKFSQTLHLFTSHFNNAKNVLEEVNIKYQNLLSKIDQVKLLK